VLWLFSIVLAAEASLQEVAIEVPQAEVYRLSGDALTATEASGADTPIGGEASVALCGGDLCPPLAALTLPVRVSAHGPLKVNGRGLAGGIWFAARKGKLVAVNRIPLEDYLVATVGSEMPKTFPLEALKAQAVVSRTYALSRKLRREGELVELASSTLDQVYGGLAQESAETRAAVTATAGEVLTFERQPIDAFFFSSCGGKTRDGKIVFGVDAPYLRSVACGHCSDAGNAHWRVTLTEAELARKLGEPVHDLRAEGDAGDGRAAAIVIAPSGRKLSPEAVRKAVGYTVVKSPTFSVSCARGSCTFVGQGAGHGVGMCQWGARGMALEQSGYREILAHYFPGAELKKLY
jgi:stage II sporulation protein D